MGTRRTKEEREEDLDQGISMIVEYALSFHDPDQPHQKHRFSKEEIVEESGCLPSDLRDWIDGANDVLICDHNLALVPIYGRGGGYWLRNAIDITMQLLRDRRISRTIDARHLRTAERLQIANLAEQANKRLTNGGEPPRRWNRSQDRIETMKLLTGKSKE